MAQMLKHGLVNGPYKKQSAGVVQNNLCFFPVNNYPFSTCCGLRVGRGFKHLYTTYRLPKVQKGRRGRVTSSSFPERLICNGVNSLTRWLRFRFTPQQKITKGFYGTEFGGTVPWLQAGGQVRLHSLTLTGFKAWSLETGSHITAVGQ